MADENEGFDAGPFSMMAVAAMEGHYHTIEFAGKTYGAMQYHGAGNMTPLMVFGRGMVRFNDRQEMMLWVGLNKYEKLRDGDWLVMLSRSEYAIMRVSQSESLFSIMPNVARNTPEGRLARIAQQHTKDTLDSGMTSGLCVECDHRWPCPTYVWATKDRDSIENTWDPADDNTEEEV